MKKQIETIKKIILYKEMIYMLVKKNLRGRYKASVLGFAWTFINPLLQLIVYTMVFSVIMRSDIEKYYLFLFVALIPWLAMSSSIIEGASCIVSESGLVTKVYFPRQVLPIITVVTNFVNMCLCMIVVIAVCAIFKGINPLLLIFLVPTIFVEFFLALSIVFIFSGLTVYFRDLQHILGIFVMAWQFLSPIMYSISIVPQKFQLLFNLNPMTPIITCFRDILYYSSLPNIKSLLYSFSISVVLLVLGWFIFDKLEKKFAEVL